MNADQGHAKTSFTGLYAGLTDRVLRMFFDVYNELGGGFLESVYQRALLLALREDGLRVSSEVAVPVYFREESRLATSGPI